MRRICEKKGKEEDKRILKGSSSVREDLRNGITGISDDGRQD